MYPKTTTHRLIPGLENSLGRISTTKRGNVILNVLAYKFAADRDGVRQVYKDTFTTEAAAVAWIKLGT